MEGAIWSFYIWEEISRCLFQAIILAEGYNKEWRDLEEAVQSFYNWGEIFKDLFKTIILMKRYNKKLFKTLIIGEKYRGNYLELLYSKKDIIRDKEIYLEFLY